MKQQLLAVGDSFTWGDELEDPYQAWPYQLADLLDYEVHNLGLSGASNTSILRRTLEELADNNYDLVVIGWTSAGRFEWRDDTGIAYNMWPGNVISNSSDFFTNQPWRLDLLSYISQYHNSAYLYQQYLIQVISLQSYFEANNIEYRMIDTVYNNYYRKVGAEQHNQLAAKIRTGKFIGWGEFGMSELTQDCPRGPGHHPLQKGHAKISREIYQRLK